MARRTSSSQRVPRTPFERLRTTGSSAYRLYVLLAFYARAKKPLFDPEVTALFAQVLPEVCASYDYDLIAYRLRPNQVHLIVGFKPTDAITDVVSDIKRSTAHRLFEGIPRLETEIGKRNFWAEGYYAETLGYTQIAPTLRAWQNRAKQEEPLLLQIVYDMREPIQPKQIERVLDELLPGERVVMRLLHGLQGEQVHTLEQAAEKLSLKPEEVHQIAQAALEKVRTLLRERDLERSEGRHR